MAGADYDYTKSLLPAGNGQLHAMSGGGHVQEGGANLSEATLKTLFDFDVKESDVDNMILSSLTKKEEAVLNKDLIFKLFKKFSQSNPLFKELKDKPNTTFLLYNIQKSSSIKDKEYIITSHVLPVKPAKDLKNIIIDTTTPNQPSGNIVTSDNYLKLFFDNLFNLVDPSKSVNILHLLVSFKLGSKPNIFIPVITKIEESGKGKTVKLISQDIYDELDKIIKSESSPGPVAGSTASTGPVAGSTASVAGSTTSVAGSTASASASTGSVAGSTGSVAGSPGMSSMFGITGATAAPIVPTIQAEKTITVLGTPYRLMMDVRPEDFTKLDEPGMEELKKLHHDFGLDYIKDGREPANMKKAEFINNLEKCQTTMTTLADEDCTKFRGIVTEVINNIVGTDIQPGGVATGSTASPTGSTGSTASPTGSTGSTASPTGSTGSTASPTGSTASPTGSTGSTASPTGSTASPTGSTGSTASPTGSTGSTASPGGSTGSTASPRGSTGSTASPGGSTAGASGPSISNPNSEPTVPRGVRAFANSCYFNAITQMLYRITNIRNKVLATDSNDFLDDSKLSDVATKYFNDTTSARYTADKAAKENQRDEWIKKWKQTFGAETPKLIAKKEATDAFKLKEKEVETSITTLEAIPSYETLITKKYIRTIIQRLKNKINSIDNSGDSDVKKASDKKPLEDEIVRLKKLFNEANTVEDADKIKDKTTNKVLYDAYVQIEKLFNELMESKLIMNNALEDNLKTQANYDKHIKDNFTDEIIKIEANIAKYKTYTKDNLKDALKKYFQSLKNILADLDDPDTSKKALNPEADFKELLKYLLGKYKEGCQEDARDFYGEVIQDLMLCHKDIQELYKKLVYINIRKSKKCIDDITTTPPDSEDRPEPILGIDFERNTDQSTLKVTGIDADIQELIENLKKSEPVELKECNDYADNFGNLIQDINVPDQNKYIIINLKRSITDTHGGKEDYNQKNEANINNELTFDGKIYRAIGAVLKMGTTAFGHYVYQVFDKSSADKYVKILYECDDGNIKAKAAYNPITNATLILYERKTPVPMTGGSLRNRNTMGKTMRTSRIAPEQSGGKRTLKARTSAPTSKPSPTQTRRRHLKARTTQSRTERSRVSGRLPIRRVGGK